MKLDFTLTKLGKNRISASTNWLAGLKCNVHKSEAIGDNNQYAAYIGTAVAILSAICKMSLSVTVLLAVVGAFIGIVAF